MNSHKRFITSALFGILLALFLTSLSCQSQELVVKRDTQTAEPTFTASLTPAPCLQGLPQVPFDTLNRSRSYGGSEHGLLLAVIDSPQDVESFKGYLHHDEVVQTLQNFDYQSEIAVLLASGTVPSSGYDILIDHVLIEGNTLTLCATFHKPPYGTLVTDMIEYPYHLISLRKSDLPAQQITAQLILDGQIITATSELVAHRRDDYLGVWVVENQDNAFKPYESKTPGLLVIADVQEVQLAQGMISNEAIRRLQEQFNYNDAYPIALVFFEGQKSTNGYQILVDAVARDDEKLTVHVFLTKPLDSWPKKDEMTSPYAVIFVQSLDPWPEDVWVEVVSEGQVIVTNRP